MKKLNLKNILWKEGKCYVAQCLNVDVSSFLYFEDMKFSKIKKIGNPVIVSEELQYA